MNPQPIAAPGLGPLVSPLSQSAIEPTRIPSRPDTLATLRACYQGHYQRVFSRGTSTTRLLESLVELLEAAQSALPHAAQAGQLESMRKDLCSITHTTLAGAHASIPERPTVSEHSRLSALVAAITMLIKRAPDLRATSLNLCSSLSRRIDFHPDQSSTAPGPRRLVQAQLLTKTEMAGTPDMPPRFRRLKTLQLIDENSGGVLALTNSLNHGGFGKFRLGATQAGELLAVKELRLNHRPGQQGRHYKTHCSSAGEVGTEVKHLRLISSRLAPLQEINFGHKRLLLMEAMAGDLFGISQLFSRNVNILPHEVRHAQRTLANSMLLHIARELVTLHRAGAVHCDLKPMNMLFAKDGEIVLADLGSTKPQGLIARSYCTPQYMPPEDDGRTKLELKPSFDIYSLGASWLGVLLPTIHRLSWSADRDMALSMHRPALKIEPDVAPFVWQRMMHPNPNKRPSAREVVEFMESCDDLDLRPEACRQVTQIILQPLLEQHERIKTRLEHALADATNPRGAPPTRGRQR